MYIKKNEIKTFILVLFVFGCSVAQQNYFVKEHERRIQLDGFLLEWKSSSSKNWYKDSLWLWDVINTPEGITGYFKSKMTPECSDWTFTFKNNDNSRKFIIAIRKDTLNKGNSDFYQIDRQTLSTSGIVIVEWVIPWDSLKIDSSGLYKIHVTGVSACGDSLAEITMSGNQKISKSRSVWSGTAIRFVMIAVLAIVFIYMRRKVRKKRSRKKSPHQST